MYIDELRAYCLAKPGVEETFPFDHNTLAMKVMGKIFLLFDIEDFSEFNAKCNPEWAIELREQYPEGIRPGYHMNKQHWNTVSTFHNIPESLLIKLVDHSYELVVKGLTKSQKSELGDMSKK